LTSQLYLPPVVPSKKYSVFFLLLEIFKSWFWRYFDHLFYLFFYNFCWAFSCFGVGWLFVRFNFIGISKRTDFFDFFLIYIMQAIASLGWAYLVFEIFIKGEGSLKDVWFGIKKYIFKATGVSIVSGFVIALTFFNIRFYFSLNNPHRYTDFLLIGFILGVLIFWLISSLYYWPILFFQNPPFFKIFYKSFLLALGNSMVSILILTIYIAFILLFSIVWPLWFFLGGVFLFSFQCVVLEKHLLMYKITYGNKSLESLLEILDYEQKRGWREFFKPWESQ
jgi:hypothetical protein